MSAYVVGKGTIDVIVSALREWKIGHGAIAGLARLDPHEAGKRLWRENVKSICYRYDDHTGMFDEAEIEAYRFRELHNLKPGGVAKVVGCYDYQSCEHPEWEASDAYAACRAVEAKLLTLLPGYASGPWGIDKDSDLLAVCDPGVISLTSLVKRSKK